MTVYRGVVLQTHQDVHRLEEAMPMWLIKYLLFNEIPIPTPLVKLSFVLLPWNKDPECEPLPELLNTYVDFLPSLRSDNYEPFSTQSRLTAHRNLRVLKLIHHVWRSIFVLRCAKVFVCPRSKTNWNKYRDRAHDQRRTIILSQLALEGKTCMRSSVMTRCFRLE